MPNVEGHSLRDRLDATRQLPVDEAVRLAIEVAGALDFAHRHDVVHRDIKPENIMIQDGHALVADFGIGKALDAVGNATVTQAGMSVGTPAYMSPEQAAGETVDGRSDIYSLGSRTTCSAAGPTGWRSADFTDTTRVSRRSSVPLPCHVRRSSSACSDSGLD